MIVLPSVEDFILHRIASYHKHVQLENISIHSEYKFTVQLDITIGKNFPACGNLFQSH
jgi:hypothetical protein